MKNMIEIGTFCKTFREDVLHETLKEVCEDTETNFKTLSAFEHGRSKNIQHIFKYLQRCDKEQRKQFINQLFEIVGDL